MDDSRRYPPRPILGVGAVVLDRGRVLAVERNREPLAGQWSLPGGVVEAGERLADAVRREVREETGLEVEPVRLVTVFEKIMPDPQGRTEYHYVIADYLCRLIGGQLQAASDVSQARWLEPSELESYPVTEGMLDVVRKALGS